MSPVNLGALPSTAPALTGVCQRKTGAANTVHTWDNTVPQQPLQDGAGGAMAIYMTPAQRGWWGVHAQTLWVGEDAVWIGFEIGLILNPADLHGRTTFKTQHTLHPAQSWQTINLDGAYWLEASTAYSCVIAWIYSGGYRQTYHTYWLYHYLEGEFIGEGSTP